MKYVFLYLLPLIAFSTLNAQKKKDKIHFTSINSLGMLNGEIASTFTMQSINGIQYKKLNAGIGIGIDNYGYRTLPITFYLKQSFLKGKTHPFLYSDIGVGKYLKTNDNSEKWPYGLKPTSVKNSFCGEWGVGIEKSIGDGCMFFVSAGYSLKKFAYTQNIYWLNSPTSNDFHYDYSYNRFVIRMGVQL